MARPIRHGPASPAVARVIELMLTSGRADQIKAGLQRACEVLERGQAFVDSGFLILAVHVQLPSAEVKVRRWAYKLAALLRHIDFLPQLERALLLEESDPENRTWAAAAYFGIANEQQQYGLVKRLDDEYLGTPLELAAKLYARGEPVWAELDLKKWEEQPLARKWLSLLCGYAGINSRTIDKRFADLDLVRNAVLDKDAEIVEYSIWAEHRHPLGSVGHLRRPVHELQDHANVRRWLYRLLTKDEDAAKMHADLLTEAMFATRETEMVAREGLALGLANIEFPDRRIQSIEWFSAEGEERVRLALVDHLAFLANKHDDPIARDTLVAEFGRHGPVDLLGLKILSVARPEWGLAGPGSSSTKGTTRQPTTADLWGQPTQLIKIERMDVHMGDRNINQSGSGNSISGNNLGEMISSTIQALSSQRDQNFSELTPQIEQFLRSVEASELGSADKQAVIKAVTEVTQAGNVEDKKDRLAMLKGIARGVLAVPSVGAKLIEDSTKLVEAITSVVG